MIFKLGFVSALAASIAAAAPASQIQERQDAETGITVVLTSNTVKPWIQYDNVNATGVIIEWDVAFDNVLVSRECPEVCIPEYNCQLYNKSLEPILVAEPGNTPLDHIQIGKVACGLF